MVTACLHSFIKSNIRQNSLAIMIVKALVIWGSQENLRTSNPVMVVVGTPLTEVQGAQQ
jgi:hypothetical protein